MVAQDRETCMAVEKHSHPIGPQRSQLAIGGVSMLSTNPGKVIALRTARRMKKQSRQHGKKLGLRLD